MLTCHLCSHHLFWGNPEQRPILGEADSWWCTLSNWLKAWLWQLSALPVQTPYTFWLKRRITTNIKSLTVHQCGSFTVNLFQKYCMHWEIAKSRVVTWFVTPNSSENKKVKVQVLMHSYPPSCSQCFLATRGQQLNLLTQHWTFFN